MVGECTPPEAERACVGRAGQFTCGVFGLVLATAALALAYSTVVAATSVVPLLSTTAIAFVAVFTWLGAWLLLTVAVESVLVYRSRPTYATSSR